MLWKWLFWIFQDTLTIIVFRNLQKLTAKWHNEFPLYCWMDGQQILKWYFWAFEVDCDLRNTAANHGQE